MTKIEIPEAVAEKEKLSKEYDKLLADRKTILEKYNTKMIESAGTDAYANVIKERNLEVQNGIDIRLNEIQRRVQDVNKIINAAKPKVEVKEDKEKKKSKKDDDEDEE